MLRARTRLLHARAERSGIVGALLSGQATRDGYSLFLRNLLPAYLAMESGLLRRWNTPGLQGLVRPEMFRASAIERDLVTLCGPGWSRTLPLLPAGARYGRRAEGAAAGRGARLIGHAYVRYLGDLSGGQILKRLLPSTLGLDQSALAFYDFPGIADPGTFRMNYREALDHAACEIGDSRVVVEEAVTVFRLNIGVSEAVQAWIDREARC